MFCPYLPTIFKEKDIEEIYELWGVSYSVELELPDGETLEAVRPGYYGASMSNFKDGGLSFLLSHFLLEALAELEMAFTQMSPNFVPIFLDLVDSS